METRFPYKETEPRWLQEWQSLHLGTPGASTTDPFVMVIPPPNITGNLHMGHALDNLLPDCLVRYYMTLGRTVLRVPGTDHAGIATQYVVEKNLKAQGIDRNSLSREQFETLIKEWAEKTKTNILNQLTTLGCLMDFSRTRFTMDEICSKAVKYAFKTLYDQGLIYQGERLISWCPRCRSALSDLELEWQTTKSRIYFIKYPISGGGDVTIATTRPETLLGDSAVAVNPEDPRFKHLDGKQAILPLMERLIPVIMDYRVDSSFGTGALKVTPGHDPLDWAMGQDHHLPVHKIIGEDGTLTQTAGAYAGLTPQKARQKVLEDLKAKELLIKEEPYTHNVGICYRCSQTAEPLISKQWFLKMDPLRDLALEAYKKGQPKFYPEHWGEIYFKWLSGLKDWCLSRQIIWGHRIPVWHCRAKSCPPHCSIEAPLSCPVCGSKDLQQDPDVLDTWFSSSLWPMSVFGWPGATNDFKKFYPTTLMVTGYDITYLWVARMVMMGLYFTQKVPFETVYLHGLIRDSQGRKMSKTLGNVIDPQDIQSLHGTDALRFTLLEAAQPGRDYPLPKDAFTGAKNFTTKLWNASRFILMEWEKKPRPNWRELLLNAAAGESGHLSDFWILNVLNTAASEAEKNLANLNPAAALRLAYDAFWGNFCDWYIEIAKIRLRAGDEAPLPVLLGCLENFLKILQPATPFITHEIAHEFRSVFGYSAPLAVQPWPKPINLNKGRLSNAAEWWKIFEGTVNEIRSLRSDLGLPPDQVISIQLGGSQTSDNHALIEGLTRSRLAPGSGTKIRRALFDGSIELFAYLDKDWDQSKETKRINEELGQIKTALERLSATLSRTDFVNKAPTDIIEKEKSRLQTLTLRQQKLNDYLSQLKQN